MAALWKLPIVTRTTVTPVTEISRGLGADRFLETRRVSFAIPGEPVDGMDVRSVHAARQSAFEHARTGKGPYILEMHTYRYRVRSMKPKRDRSMDINQVRYFLNLAETLNFTEAARRSGVSQPSLTRAIQRLEEDLGSPLIYR
ncbi:LysR family transcriptional regulator, partial [Sinorhizobium meliloti]